MFKLQSRHFIYLLIALTVVLLAWRYGADVYHLCNNREALKAYLNALGNWAPAMFVILTAVQVIVAPIPAIALSLAGGYMFGVIPGFSLNMLGLLIGSILAFTLARLFGQPLVMRLVGVSTYRQFEPVISGKGLWAVMLVFLLPMMPDDALCFLAGLTPMRIRTFAFLVLTCRSPGVLVASLTGSGTLRLPWQLWIMVAAVSLVLLYLGWRHSEKLQKWLCAQR